MYYYSTEDTRRGKLVGAAATVLYFVVGITLMLLVTFSFEPRSVEEGIMINFGDSEQASGLEDPALTKDIAQAVQTPQSEIVKEQEVLTQEHEEAPVVAKKKPKPKKETVESIKPTQSKPIPTPTPVEKPREVNQKALFPGKTVGSTSTSEGTGKGTGNQGNPAGEPTGSHDGTGVGTSGSSFSLAGRGLIGSLPKPSYNADDQGRVVVRITVSRSGSVTNAVYQSVGSTTQNSSLVESALSAARKAKFTAAEGEDLQSGTITYIFKLK